LIISIQDNVIRNCKYSGPPATEAVLFWETKEINCFCDLSHGVGQNEAKKTIMSLGNIFENAPNGEVGQK